MRIVHSLLVAGALFYLPLTGASQPVPDSIGQPGVSRALAAWRGSHLQDIRYTLHFRIPAARQEPMTGQEQISFTLDRKPSGGGRLSGGGPLAGGPLSGGPLLLDFKGGQSAISEVRVNGHPVPVIDTNEHLMISSALLHPGAEANVLDIRFTAGNAALNRNGDFLYTLLVPDRARTLFPCFDQPDLKAIFSLSLVIPAGWKAIGNAPLLDSVTAGDSLSLHFKASDKISTYLFSFAAGKFSESDRVVGGRTMRFLYRETDSSKLRLSLDSIFRIEGQALEFMQQYTGIVYPFQKFDFVAIPDFQFGGMEHVGAIQYKASSLFLDSGATREQFIGRSNLLSHETAHMWFGDMVTMSWFNDVWMKEVFANFMADKITEYHEGYERGGAWRSSSDKALSVTLPDGNYELKFLTDHFSAAYSIDRTAGANPIRQRLDNLQEAGSLYGNIIYHKAPIVMRQLERLMGKDAFQAGLREYLRKYAGANASWPDLIAVLQAHTAMDLRGWNEVWINGAGRPQFGYRLRALNGKISDLVIRQRGEDGSSRIWPQLFELALVYKDRVEELTVNMNAASVRMDKAVGKDEPICVLFNSTGQGYGLFPVDLHSLPWLTGAGTAATPTALMRASAYINLYENMLAGMAVTPRQLLAYDRQALSREPEELNLNILLEQVNSVFWRFLSPPLRDSMARGLERDLLQAMDAVTSGNEKKLLFRAFSNIALSQEGQDRLFLIWKNRQPPAGVKLSEDDYTNLAVALALRDYPEYKAVLAEQVSRIQNKDRKERLEYLLPALSDDSAERDRYFATLESAEARRKEAWVLTALSYLHHPLRAAESEKYLPASLDWLADIQRTGDVFFPQSWLQATLSWYQTATAAAVVRQFLQQHPDYNPKLKAKIQQAADNLFRAEKLVK
jgi:aminopeptidase N